MKPVELAAMTVSGVVLWAAYLWAVRVFGRPVLVAGLGLLVGLLVVEAVPQMWRTWKAGR